MEQMHPGLVIECTVLQATCSLISVMFKVNDSDVFTGALIRSPTTIPRLLNPDLTEKNEKYTEDEREQMANEIMKKYPRGIGRLRMADPKRMLFRQLLGLELKTEEELPKTLSKRGRKPMVTGKKRGRKPKCRIKTDTDSPPNSVNNPDRVHVVPVTKNDAFQLETDANKCDNTNNENEIGELPDGENNTNPHLTVKNKRNNGLVVKQKRGRKPKNLKNTVSTSDAAELNKFGNGNGAITTSDKPIDPSSKKKRGRKPLNREKCARSESELIKNQPAIESLISVPFGASSSEVESRDPLRIFGYSNGSSTTLSNGTFQAISPNSAYQNQIFSSQASPVCDNSPHHNGTCLTSDEFLSNYRMFIHPYTNPIPRKLPSNDIHQPYDYAVRKPNNFSLPFTETDNKSSCYNSVPIEENGLSHFSDFQRYQYEINNGYSNFYSQGPSYSQDTRNINASSLCPDHNPMNPSPAENSIDSNNSNNELGNTSTHDFKSFYETNESCKHLTFGTHESSPTSPENSYSANHFENSCHSDSELNSVGNGMVTESPDENCCPTQYMDSFFSTDRETNCTPTDESCDESKMTPPCSYHFQDPQAETFLNYLHDQNGSDEIGKVSLGSVVWGKLYNHPWWPGEIVDISDNSPNNPIASVRWFGTNILSVLYSKYLLPFQNYSVEQICGSNLTEALLDATIHAKIRHSELTSQSV